MWADLSLQCFVGVHNHWAIFAIVAMVVFTFGIPTLSFVILYTNQRKMVLQTPLCKARYGFLYAAYADRVWYWELIEMFRKLLFTSGLMFLASGSSSQVVIAMMISFVWLVAHLHMQAYKEENDSFLQTASLISIFVTLWIGLLHREGVTQEFLEQDAMFSAIYQIITTAVGGLPLVAALGGLFASVGKAIATICSSNSCPDLGIGTMVKGLLPGASFQQKHDAALGAALGLEDYAAFSKGGQDAFQRRSSAKLERRLSRISGELDNKDKYRAQALAARAGKPYTSADKHHKLYMVPLQLSQEAIVLRNYPIGKGFLVRLPDEDKYYDEVEDEGRPPYMFVKCWKVSYARLTGAVHVQYDVRDTGWKLDRNDVSYHPDEANKALLVWEAKKALGTVAAVASVGTKALAFAGKLGRPKKDQVGHAAPFKITLKAVKDAQLFFKGGERCGWSRSV